MEKAKKTERTVHALLEMIYNGELQLPEIKRGYKWTPRHAAKFIGNLYNGHPTGQLALWVHNEAIRTRLFSLNYPAADPINHLSDPIYLVGGEQRLTALGRAFRDHPDTQIVFNIQTQEFRVKGAKTPAPLWVKLSSITGDDTNQYALVDKLLNDLPQIDRNELAKRLFRVCGILRRRFDITVLTGTSYRKIYDICKSDGKLSISESARQAFAVSWPGITDVLQAETQHWKGEDYGLIDSDFLAQALLAATHGELSRFAVEAAEETDRETLEARWRTIKGGLRHLVWLLKKNLRATHCNYFKSPLVLLPLIIYLGERPSEHLDPEVPNALLYWLLVATIRKRNKNESDGTLSQDIAAVRGDSPVWGLHNNLGTIRKRFGVTEEDLIGPYDRSSYLLLSFLCVQDNGAHDWWFGIGVGGGGDTDQILQHHHIHPQATLRKHRPSYPDDDIDDLANIAFISAKANNKISNRSPLEYFLEVDEGELSAHCIPLEERLRKSSAYGDFLAERRRLLARSMTAYLNRMRPLWLDTHGDPAALPPGARLKFVRYRSSWDEGRIIATARYDNREWAGIFSAAALLEILKDIEQELGARATEDIAEDDYGYVEDDLTITIGNDSVPIQLDSGSIQIQFGPFLVLGTAEEWLDTIERHRLHSRQLADLPAISPVRWDGDPIPFPVCKIM